MSPQNTSISNGLWASLLTLLIAAAACAADDAQPLKGGALGALGRA